MNELGYRIRLLREAKGMTQTDLADKIGVTWSAISKYERGVVDNLPYGRMMKMAEVLGTTPGYLLGGRKPQSNLVVDDDDNLPYDDEAMIELYKALNSRPRLREVVDEIQGMTDTQLEKVLSIVSLVK